MVISKDCQKRRLTNDANSTNTNTKKMSNFQSNMNPLYDDSKLLINDLNGCGGCQRKTFSTNVPKDFKFNNDMQTSGPGLVTECGNEKKNFKEDTGQIINNIDKYEPKLNHLMNIKEENEEGTNSVFDKFKDVSRSKSCYSKSQNEDKCNLRNSKMKKGKCNNVESLIDQIELDLAIYSEEQKVNGRSGQNPCRRYQNPPEDDSLKGYSEEVGEMYCKDNRLIDEIEQDLEMFSEQRKLNNDDNDEEESYEVLEEINYPVAQFDYSDGVENHSLNEYMSDAWKNNVSQQIGLNGGEFYKDLNNQTENHDGNPNSRQMAESSQNITNFIERSGDGCNTPKNKCLQPSCGSAEKGWERTKQKFNRENLNISPIKQVEFHLKPLMHDEYFSGYVWVTSMSEQLYYDNIIMLISHKIDDDKQVKICLRRNYIPIDYQMVKRRWFNIELLGSGSYGDVYSVEDFLTGDKYAIKYLKAINNNCRFKEHAMKILNYLQERNYLIHCHSSPFVVKFYFSFTFTEINGLFLVCEYCISDLERYLKILELMTNYDLNKAMLDNQMYGMMTTEYSRLSQSLNYNVEEVLIMYCFEMLCGMDFLAQINVVHRDIKPANILIDKHGHLKIADLGLVYNTHFITRFSQAYLSNTSDFDWLDVVDESHGTPGTKRFKDFEMIYAQYISFSNKKKCFVDHKDLIEQNIFPDTMMDAQANFLSDLWSIGLTIFETLFLNRRIIDYKKISKDVQKSLQWTRDFTVDVLQTFCLKEPFTRYVKYGIFNALGASHEQLADFIVSLFLPRHLRAVNYRKSKTIKSMKCLKLAHVIDINEIEKISSFKSRDLNSQNVFLRILPDVFFIILYKNPEEEFEDCDEWFNYLGVKQNSEQFFDIKPGYDIEM